MSRRRIALLVLLACALPLGGWLVVGPVLPARMPAVAEPPIDIDTPSGRAPPAATLASSRRPDGSSSQAAAVASSPAASGSTDKARCGEDQLPRYRMPEPDSDGMIHVQPPVADPDGIVRRLPGEIQPAGVGYTGAMRRIDAALRSSGTPFDRAMADWLDLDATYTPAARIDALVQDATAAADPRVYALAYETCNPRQFGEMPGFPKTATSPACGRLNATEWARLDPGNGVPWLYALDRADRLGDEAGQREAFDRLAASSRFDIRHQAGAAAVARLQLPGDADLAAQMVAAEKALPISMPPFQSLTARCRDRAGGDADRAATCARIAEMLFEHSDSLLPRAIGGSVHKQLTGDAAWLDRAHQEQHSFGDHFAATVVDTSPCGAARDGLKYFVRLGAVGETGLLKESRHAASAP